VSVDPKTEIPLVGGGRLIVNEPLPSTGADGGEVVVAASTDSVMHNFGD